MKREKPLPRDSPKRNCRKADLGNPRHLTISPIFLGWGGKGYGIRPMADGFGGWRGEMGLFKSGGRLQR
jgi:hypothetical protein